MATYVEARITELRSQRQRKLASLQISLTRSLAREDDEFAGPNLNLFAAILTLEAQIRELAGLQQ